MNHLIRWRIRAAFNAAEDARRERTAKEGGASICYCIGDGGAVKIGLADNPWRRLDSLQTGAGRHLTMLAVVGFDTRESAAWAERKAQKRLKHLRIRGEWFQTDARAEFVRLFPNAKTGKALASRRGVN